MKYYRKNTTSKKIAIIAVSLLFMCRITIGQPVYHPWFRPAPYRSDNRPYPRMQNARQEYNPWQSAEGAQRYISFGVHFDPLISWFSTDSYDVRNEGAIPGFNLGISYNRYFGPNYSFSSGVNFINAGGRLISDKTNTFELKNYSRETYTVDAGEAIIYKITYLSVPLGLKLQTDQTDYGTFFTDLGFDPKILVAGRADIPSLNIKGGNALPELRTFNLSYHLMVGMEYPLQGYNNIVIGIGFDNNFFDITRDIGNQTWDMVSHKLLSFRVGITF